MAELKAGAAEVVITPPVGVELEGYGARKHPSVGVHDDLYAHALVLDDGETRAGLLTCDLVGVDRELVAEVRRLVEQAGALKGGNLMVSATHTHSGPRGLLRLRGAGDRALIELTSRKLAGAVIAASQEMHPARLKLGKSLVDSVGQNRRFPDGLIDPTLYVLRVEEAGTGELLAALVNFTMHATVMNYDNLLVSADYPGQVRKVIRRVLGDVPVLFANGTCGNTNPARVAAVFSEVERIGTVLGAEAVRVLCELGAVGRLVAADNLLWGERTPKPPPAGALDLASPSLKVASTQIELPLRPYDPSGEVYQERIAGLRRELAALGLDEKALAQIRQSQVGLADIAPEVVTRRRELMGQLTRLSAELASLPRRKQIHDLIGSAALRTEIQALQLSPEVVIVGLPGDVVVEIGLAVKAASRRSACLVFAYTNDSIGYTVMPAHFAEGGYEAGQTLFEPTAERLMREAALGLVADLAQ